MASSSSTNPQTVSMNSFSFKLSPARILKHAVRALSDNEFNKPGTAMIEVESYDVGITVCNAESADTGFLRLDTTRLVNFDLVKPLKRKVINLKEVSKNLETIDDGCAVTVYHVDGSNELSFESESTSVMKFAVELNEIDPQFGKFPDIAFADIAFACESTFPNGFLWMILRAAQATTSKNVTVEWSKSGALISAGEKSFRFPVKGLKKGQIYMSWFTWPHCETLRKAMKLTEKTILYLISDTKKSIVFRFNLELGDLVFVTEGTTHVLR